MNTWPIECDHAPKAVCEHCAPGGVIARVCLDCKGHGAVPHLSRDDALQKVDCGACNGHGWMWTDGVRPEQCVERHQIACGRMVQCRSCPHVAVMKIGGG